VPMRYRGACFLPSVATLRMASGRSDSVLDFILGPLHAVWRSVLRPLASTTTCQLVAACRMVAHLVFASPLTALGAL
jgi:hypothetical protein